MIHVHQEILGCQMESAIIKQLQMGETICYLMENRGNVTPMHGLTRLYFHSFNSIQLFTSCGISSQIQSYLVTFSKIIYKKIVNV